MAAALAPAVCAEPEDPAPGHLHRMHGPLASFGAATTSDAIYVLGGHVGGAHEHSRENLSPRLVRYPLDDPGAWQELPGGVGLQSVALVAWRDELFRVGGMQARNAADEDEDLWSVDAFARYRGPDARAAKDGGPVETGPWETVLPLPGRRSSHDAIFLDDTLWVLGGWRLGNGAPHWYSEGWSLDLTDVDAGWRSVEQPFERRALAVAAAHGKLYAIGGLTRAGDTSSAVDVYDPRTDTWAAGPELPVTGFGATAFGTEEGLFFLGRDGFLWRLDAGADAWTAVRPTAFPRFFSRLVPAGPSLLAILGGASPQGRPGLLEVVSTGPERDRAAADAPVVSRLSLPFPGRTRQRQAAFVYENRLYLFGGNVHAERHHFDAGDFSDEGWSVDLLTGEWREEPPLPAARQSMRVVVLDGPSPSALVAGGYGRDEEGPRSWSEVFLFDLVGRTWHPAGVELPHALTQFGWFATDDAVWTSGGIAYHPDRDGDFGPGDALYRWEMGSDADFVEASAALRARCRAFAWAEHDGSLYRVGGMGDDFAMIDVPERVDLATGAVTPIAAPAQHRLGASLVALAGRLYLTGGTSEGAGGRSFDPSLEAYDPQADRWHAIVEALPVPAEQLRLCVWGERLVAFSTAREGRVELAFVTPPGARPAGGGFEHP